jgi:hypothetical protein
MPPSSFLSFTLVMQYVLWYGFLGTLLGLQYTFTLYNSSTS